MSDANEFRRRLSSKFAMVRTPSQFEQRADRHVRLSRVDDRADVTLTDHESGRLKVRSEKWAGRAWMDLSPRGQTLRPGRPWRVAGQGDRLEIDCEGRRGKAIRGVTHRFSPGSFEWEEIYATAADLPETPYVAYDVSTPPGLRFHYQPELTAEEIAEGCERPDNVVGSYAVYWPESGRILRPDGTERVNYETGKYCHIYRPQWFDAAGARCWGQQTITEGQLLIAVPAEWISSAERRWPVTLDPQFGYSSIGGSPNNFGPNTISALGLHSLPSDGVVQSITCYCGLSVGESTYGIYSKTAPYTRLGDTSGGTPTQNSWHTLSLDSPLELSADNYWLALNELTWRSIAYDTVAGFYRWYEASAYVSGSLTVAFVAPARTSNFKCSIYATYTEAATTKFWLRSGRSRIFGGGII